jgi:predicted acylesterase/phospholipase RssA
MHNNFDLMGSSPIGPLFPIFVEMPSDSSVTYGHQFTNLKTATAPLRETQSEQKTKDVRQNWTQTLLSPFYAIGEGIKFTAKILKEIGSEIINKIKTLASRILFKHQPQESHVQSSEQVKPLKSAIQPSLPIRELKLDSGQSIIFNPNTNRYVYIAPAPPVTNLVISGGGAKGVILPGVFQAFEEHKVNKDLSFRDQIENVCGSSVGALTSGLFAAGIPAKTLNEIMSNVDFKGLLGTGKSPVLKDGVPMLDFIRTNMRNGIEDNLKAMFGVNDLNEITKEKIKQYLEASSKQSHEGQINRFAKVIEKLKDPQACVTFSVLNDLHALNPKIFKKLTVTATCRETGQTFYFNAQNTPNLDVALACRASASLPIILDPVKIDKESLSGGIYEETIPMPLGYLTFVDGGYFDNIPVSAMEGENADKSSKGVYNQNLQTLALVFDDSDKTQSPQSPFHEVKIKKHAIYNPTNWKERLTRDFLARIFAKIKTKKRNTEAKSKGLEKIREQYTQRSIPLNVSIKTTDFVKAKEVQKEYVQTGLEQGKEYLKLHQDELLSRDFESFDELLEYVPTETKTKMAQEINQFKDQQAANDQGQAAAAA